MFICGQVLDQASRQARQAASLTSCLPAAGADSSRTHQDTPGHYCSGAGSMCSDRANGFRQGRRRGSGRYACSPGTCGGVSTSSTPVVAGGQRISPTERYRTGVPALKDGPKFHEIPLKLVTYGYTTLAMSSCSALQLGHQHGCEFLLLG